jgi:hypothetical protein
MNRILNSEKIEWVPGEPGPTCKYCGKKTIISQISSVYQKDVQDWFILCRDHFPDGKALAFPLPESKPDNWLIMTSEEFDQMIYEAEEKLRERKSIYDIHDQSGESN